MNNCENCNHWKNGQRLLNYSKYNGFCINPKFKFNIKTGRLIGVVDIENLRDRGKVTGNPANDIETKNKMGQLGVTPSKYLLQTAEIFGCNFYEKN